MLDQFSRTRLLLGEVGMEKLLGARVAVFGLGGVGGYTVEALARSGVGALDLIDDDRVCLTNLNRQILAIHGTIGEYKTDVARERILAINPDAQVRVYRTFYGPETEGEFDFSHYDYVVDAIDTVTGKIELVLQAERSGTPIISCMGAGNKLDASAFEVADIYETSVCPLARVMRRELKKRGIKKLKVVYSKESPLTPTEEMTGDGEDDGICSPEADGKRALWRQTPGSTAFVPAVAGLILAGEVVRDLTAQSVSDEPIPGRQQD
ncbi:MAG: tRNA threonylcarbamoyladenosine dehydratase [Lachnospiraceae bacterium]|nr:tRNA threonylcarbamoyladenosine dehydratase [Lachnospiraceae bacterium]